MFYHGVAAYFQQKAESRSYRFLQKANDCDFSYLKTIQFTPESRKVYVFMNIVMRVAVYVTEDFETITAVANLSTNFYDDESKPYFLGVYPEMVRALRPKFQRIYKNWESFIEKERQENLKTN